MAITESPNCWLSGLGWETRWWRNTCARQDGAVKASNPPTVPRAHHGFSVPQFWPTSKPEDYFAKSGPGAGAKPSPAKQLHCWILKNPSAGFSHENWMGTVTMILNSQQNAELNWYEPIFKANNIHRFPDQFWGFTIPTLPAICRSDGTTFGPPGLDYVGSRPVFAAPGSHRQFPNLYSEHKQCLGMHTCVHACVYIYIHMYVCVYVYVYVTCICKCTCMSIHVNVNVYMFMCVDVCMYVCMHACMHACMHVGR